MKNISKGVELFLRLACFQAQALERLKDICYYTNLILSFSLLLSQTNLI